MHKKLIVEAFEKARKELQESGTKSPSISATSESIVYTINEETNLNISSRTLRNYYNDAINSEDTDINISRQEILEALCAYLGYNDYKSFISKSSKGIKKKKRNYKYLLIALILLGVSIATILFFNKNEPRFMIWKTDHYEEVSLDLNTYSLQELKVFKQERIDNFRKIDPKCEYEFYNADGSPKVWYGKNLKKDYEYFTSLGLHPETGKTLKEITDYMIKHHICNKP